MTEAELPERPEFEPNIEPQNSDAARIDLQNSGSMAGGQQGAAGDRNVQNQGDNNSIGNTIYQFFCGAKSPSDTVDRPNDEKILLQEVRTEVADRLNTSLHQAVFVDLPKSSQRERVRRPWDTQIKVGNGRQQTLQPEMSIAEVFQQSEVGHKLLILGEPGAGKTTTMLDLAQDLIQAAEKQADQPIPVLFNLSSWKNITKSNLRNQNLSDADATEWNSIALWIISELKSKYSVANKLTWQWLNEKKLLPLLDGLDEVTPDDQADCLNAINQFLVGDIVPPGLVVCCREEEYELIASSTDKKLKLNGAICLKPLTEIQLQEYLQETGNIELWQPFHQDAMLLNLVKTPLWLSISILAINEFAIDEWQQYDSLETRRQQLLDAYVRKMLHRQIESKYYAVGKEPLAKQIREWLVILAIQLQTQSQDELLIEDIQSSWIKFKNGKIIYKTIVGSYIGLILLLLLYEFRAMPLRLLFSFYSDTFSFWLATLDLVIVIIFSVLTYIVFGDKQDIQISDKFRFQILGFVQSLKNLVLSNKHILAFAWLSLFVTALLSLIRSNWDDYKNIQYLVEYIDNFILLVILCAFIACIALAVIFPFYLGFNIPLAIIDSLKVNKIEISQKPNQGVQNSINLAKRAYFLGFAVTAVVAFGLALAYAQLLSVMSRSSFAPTSEPISNFALYLLRSTIGGGHVGGLVVAQVFLIPCVRHLAIRFTLYLNGSIPWNYARFLNYCTDRLLLQRVGGRYRFIHKLLQEHFANMPLEK